MSGLTELGRPAPWAMGLQAAVGHTLPTQEEPEGGALLTGEPLMRGAGGVCMGTMGSGGVVVEGGSGPWSGLHVLTLQFGLGKSMCQALWAVLVWLSCGSSMPFHPQQAVRGTTPPPSRAARMGARPVLGRCSPWAGPGPQGSSVSSPVFFWVCLSWCRNVCALDSA